MKSLLVAYASKTGSTQEVAEAVTLELQQQGFEVDLFSARDVKEIKKYAGVILGTAVRMNRPVGEAMKFIKKYRDELNAVPTVLFSLGLTMKENTPASRQSAEVALDPIAEEIKTVEIATFGGNLDLSKLLPIMRFAFSQDKSGNMAEGDYRDWEAIRSWAKSLGKYFA